MAVLLVVLAHAHQTRGFPNVRFLHAIAHRGSIGVEFFFVISGFLITLLMLREKALTGCLDKRRFFLRRMLRIMPAYFVFLIAVAILQACGHARLSSRDWLVATTYTVNFIRRPAWDIGHAWSLSIEEHFYLVWPFLMAVAIPRFGAAAALTCAGFCFATRWFILLAFPAYSPMAELWTFARMDAIAMGCLMAFVAWDPYWRRNLDRLCNRQPVIPAVCIVLVGSMIASAYSAKYQVGIAYSLNTLCITVLIWSALRNSGSWWVRMLNLPILGMIGIMSYSIYLWQQIFLDHQNPGLLCSFPLNVLLAVITAILSYNLIEKPFLGLKRYLVDSPPDRTRQADSAANEGRLTGIALEHSTTQS
jgi:peptidoglycan/LPS O-acetylase OafA/YrhL